MVTLGTAREVLLGTFGFSEFRAGQGEVVGRLLSGRSVLAVFPTGAGKSLCYQLPALLLDGVTLVISPLIALMKDQIDFLKNRGVAAERLDSTLEFEESRRVLGDLAGGRLKLLYVAPERLASERFLQTLKRLEISMMAVDEAHCISEWGHNFRPDYMKLAGLARELGVKRVLGLTATATPAVAGDIARAFGIGEGDVVKTAFHRKNLVLRVSPVEGAERDELLLQRIRNRPAGPTIVYVTLQKSAEDVAAFLAAKGLDARAYHAGMDAQARHEVQDWFMGSDYSIVVATIAFGMGIDKRNIRYVYHYNLPKSMENYAQEIGRAGRDGEESICEMLACADDRIVLENFTFGDTPTARGVGLLLQEVLGHGEAFDVSVYELSGKYDIRPLVVETVLTYLELDGVIASTGPFYNEYKFQPIRSSAEMLGRFDAGRQAFLRGILKCAERGKTWWKLDLSKVTAATGEPRAKIVSAMNYLEEQGDLKLQVAGARQGYRLLRKDRDLRGLAEAMVGRFAHREKRDIERLGGVIEFASREGCRTGYLLDYFGERLEGRCGHCDFCLGQFGGGMRKARVREVGAGERKAIAELKGQRMEALSTPRQLARFLCGIHSPATTRAKLRGDRRFGMLADVPFSSVMAAVKE